jgi:hypothetical protein
VVWGRDVKVKESQRAVVASEWKPGERPDRLGKEETPSGKDDDDDGKLQMMNKSLAQAMVQRQKHAGSPGWAVGCISDGSFGVLADPPAILLVIDREAQYEIRRPGEGIGLQRQLPSESCLPGCPLSHSSALALIISQYGRYLLAAN